jgi:hypothetical protein
MNKGRNAYGHWEESWYEKNAGKEKWASKKGANYITQDEWQEEWKEQQREGGAAEKVCQKWGKNLARNEEWNEKWGEHFTPEKREKWTDRWFVDWNSCITRGENWGHTYDENMQP